MIDREGIEVFLRHRREKGEVAEPGFAHPAQISSERLARILSSATVERSVREGLLRKKVSKRENAFEIELVEPLASALSEAFGQASSQDEIVVRAIRSERHYGVFVREFVTSFVTFVENDALYLDLSRLGWQLPHDEVEEEKPPLPKRGESLMEFRALPGPATRVAGPQLLAVSWRDPVFDLGGTAVSEPETAAPPPEPRPVADEPRPAEDRAADSGLPPNLDSATLRELADLAEARERGEISESYYSRQRQKLLSRAAEGDTSR